MNALWHKNTIRANKLSYAIVLFVLLFGLVHYAQPSWLYTEEGGFRSFGIGYRQKTVLPIWIVAIALGVLCYLAVLYYLVVN